MTDHTIQKSDVLQVSESLNIDLSEQQINEVIDLYGTYLYDSQFDTWNWSEIIEYIIDDIVN